MIHSLGTEHQPTLEDYAIVIAWMTGEMSESFMCEMMHDQHGWTAEQTQAAIDAAARKGRMLSDQYLFKRNNRSHSATPESSRGLIAGPGLSISTRQD